MVEQELARREMQLRLAREENAGTLVGVEMHETREVAVMQEREGRGEKQKYREIDQALRDAFRREKEADEEMERLRRLVKETERENERLKRAVEDSEEENERLRQAVKEKEEEKERLKRAVEDSADENDRLRQAVNESEEKERAGRAARPSMSMSSRAEARSSRCMMERASTSVPVPRLVGISYRVTVGRHVSVGRGALLWFLETTSQTGTDYSNQMLVVARRGASFFSGWASCRLPTSPGSPVALEKERAKNARRRTGTQVLAFAVCACRPATEILAARPAGYCVSAESGNLKLKT